MIAERQKLRGTKSVSDQESASAEESSTENRFSNPGQNSNDQALNSNNQVQNSNNQDLNPDRLNSPNHFSPALLSNLIPAAILFAAMFMPHATGCDGADVVPADRWKEEDLFIAILQNWHHLFGLFEWILFFVVLVIPNPERSDRWLAGGVLGYWLIAFFVFVFGGLSLLINHESNDSLAAFLVVTPIFVLPAIWALSAWKKRDWISMWARLSTSVALMGIPLAFFHVILTRQLRIGWTVTILSLFWLSVAPWWLRVRWRQVFIDRHESSSPIRFQIWHMMAVSALVGLLYAYYRYLVPLVDK